MAGAPQEIVEKFRARYPGSPRPRIWRAPGRINLIGEHTDYNLGLVLPMAIDLSCWVAAAPSQDFALHAFSDQLKQAADWSLSEIPNLPPKGEWSDRVVGIAWELARQGTQLRGTNLLIDSEVPLGGGLSSSAALGVSVALALGGPRDPSDLAKLARAAETDFVGVPCGIMDQFVSAQGKEGAAILLDCRSLEWRTVELPEEIVVVAANSMVRHELGDSAYRTRVAECAEAARELGIANLRDATVDMLSRLNGVLLKRTRHVLTENARVEEFVHASETRNIENMGRLITESHLSLRDDYEVSSPELDSLVESAMKVEGALGARMIGGGFGGSTITLVKKGSVEKLKTILVSEYRARWGREPEIHVCRASAGASEVIY